MRRPRLKAPKGSSQAYFHCVSRIVGREFLLGETEKNQFVSYMRLYEKLYGLRILSYVVMSNHFHILVEVPQRPADDELPNDRELVAHVHSCLGEEAATSLEWELTHFRDQNNDTAAEELREKWFSRMWDVSRYMKVLKQRFTQWYNGRNNRRGTLWENRFRSVLVQGAGAALKTMAAYIDLNPVRANICDDPKDYQWCNYAEAVADGKRAQAALQWLHSFPIDNLGTVEAPESSSSPSGKNSMIVDSEVPIEESLERWRCYLFGIPFSKQAREEELKKEKNGGKAQSFRRNVSREKILATLQSGGRLQEEEYLRCRVRYFCDGAALGSKDFVEQVFQDSREQFADERKSGARPLKGLELSPKPERLYNLRQLKKDVIT